MSQRLGELRHEPTEKRVRAMLGDEAVVDSTRAMLVWEPRRVVPSYAVPIGDVRAELAAASPDAAVALPPAPILHPGIPFAAHSTPGEALDVRAAGTMRPGVAFRPADDDLAGYVVLDFHGFDGWFDEDEAVVPHPRDPFHRIDILRSSRSVLLEVDGVLVAESERPTLLFETSLPTRFYVPLEDVAVPLRPSARPTRCAYKGEASYWSIDTGGGTHDDLVWSCEEPLREAAAVRGLVAFFDERVDVVLDGERRERPQTQWSKGMLEEAGV